MKQAKTSGVGKGTIQSGADKNSYLGHFRNAETMKRGHNQGAPGGPTMETGGFGTPPINPAHPAMNPVSNPAGFAAAGGAAHPMVSGRVRPTFNAAQNPMLAQRQSERAAGTLGTAAGRAEMGAARQRAKAIPRAQRIATAQGARSAARAETKAGRSAAIGERQQAVGGARENLQQAVGGVRSARQALGAAVRGGDIGGAGAAAGALGQARQTRKTARVGVRQAKRATYRAPAGGMNVMA